MLRNMLDGDGQDQYDSGGWCFPKPIPPQNKNDGQTRVLDPMMPVNTNEAFVAGLREYPDEDPRLWQAHKKEWQSVQGGSILTICKLHPSQRPPMVRPEDDNEVCVAAALLSAALRHRHGHAAPRSTNMANPRSIAPVAPSRALTAWTAGCRRVHQEACRDGAADHQGRWARQKLPLCDGREGHSGRAGGRRVEQLRRPAWFHRPHRVSWQRRPRAAQAALARSDYHTLPERKCVERSRGPLSRPQNAGCGRVHDGRMCMAWGVPMTSDACPGK